MIPTATDSGYGDVIPTRECFVSTKGIRWLYVHTSHSSILEHMHRHTHAHTHTRACMRILFSRAAREEGAHGPQQAQMNLWCASQKSIVKSWSSAYAKKPTNFLIEPMFGGVLAHPPCMTVPVQVHECTLMQYVHGSIHPTEHAQTGGHGPHQSHAQTPVATQDNQSARPSVKACS